MKDIDVVLIMNQLKEDAKKKEYPEEVLEFANVQVKRNLSDDEFDNAVLEKEINDINDYHNLFVKGYAPDTTLLFAKKVYHAILVRILKPVLRNQVKFNSAVARAMNQIRSSDIDKQRRTMTIMKNDIQDMYLEMLKIDQRVGELEQKVSNNNSLTN